MTLQLETFSLIIWDVAIQYSPVSSLLLPPQLLLPPLLLQLLKNSTTMYTCMTLFVCTKLFKGGTIKFKFPVQCVLFCIFQIRLLRKIKGFPSTAWCLGLRCRCTALLNTLSLFEQIVLFYISFFKWFLCYAGSSRTPSRLGVLVVILGTTYILL